MPKAADYAITCPTIALALATLTSPAAATPILVEGVATQTTAGAGGAAFNICSYPHGVYPSGYEYPWQPCDTRGTLLATMFVTFLPSQIVVDLPPDRFNDTLWIFAACTGDGTPYPGCQDAGAFGIFDAPQAQPPGTPKLSDDDKQEYRHLQHQLQYVVAGLAFAATVTRATGTPASLVGSLSMGGMAGLAAYTAIKFGELAEDPIDNNFAQIAVPTDYPLPTGISGKPCMVSGGASAGGPATFLSRSIGLAQAASTSFNRMQGAIRAGDSYWTAQQGQAMLSYNQQLRSKLDRVPLSTLFACAERAPADPASMLAYQRNLRTNGMSAEQAKPYLELGLDIKQVTGIIYSADSTLAADMHNAILGSLSSRPVYWQILNSTP